ncbi:hypothetical protein QQ054_06695 [Oscillatoria amoena NRMC-F 0135]|nr:hypothetical protein [Oscillatoria amoena NRMC-F 0135]
MSQMNYAIALKDPLFKNIGRVADELGLETYVVGGFVRDVIMGRASRDVDFVCVGSGISLANAVAKSLGPDVHVNVYKNFGTAHIPYHDFNLEFVGARKESYRSDSRKPAVEDGTLKDDQLRRDFTINAMALRLNEQDFGDLVDPFEGVSDIRKKTIRTPTDPKITFSDDPLRMMRAIRFASQLGFDIEPDTYEAIVHMADRITMFRRNGLLMN